MNNINYNFNKLTPFKFFCLTNFPFIEEDFDALTYYELLCKVVEYLNKVIDTANAIGTQTEELTNAFNELKSYVDNYFNNLDVQQEINNKLDQMAESGQLTDIIAQYLQLAGVLAYDTVEDMKSATNLVNGSICKTLGFYNYNDCGGAFYKIRNITNTDVVDNMFLFALKNKSSLVAELIINNNIIDITKIGAKNDGSADVSEIINAVTEKYSIFLPAGTYLVNKTINLKHSIFGNGYSRDNRFTNEKTLLLSNVANKTINIISNNEGTSQIIENLSIKINKDIIDTEVIRYNPTNDNRIYINKISIFDFNGIAINLDSTDCPIFVSRGVYIDTITLFAKPYSTSIGIRNASNNGDNRFNNIESMSAQKGILNYSTIFINNAHIWCGADKSETDPAVIDNWWQNSRGIENFNGKVQGENIYIDTTLVAITNNNGLVTINNFFYWEDDSIEGSTHYDSTIIYSDILDREKTIINNAIIFLGERVKYLWGKITNLKLIYKSLNNFKMNSMYFVCDDDYELFCDTGVNEDRYVPIAVINCDGVGFCRFEITTDGGNNADIYISKDWQGNLKLLNRYYNVTNNYYYKIIDNKIIIYLHTINIYTPVHIKTISKNEKVFPINVNDIVDINNNYYIKTMDILTDTTDLTAIKTSMIE